MKGCSNGPSSTSDRTATKAAFTRDRLRTSKRKGWSIGRWALRSRKRSSSTDAGRKTPSSIGPVTGRYLAKLAQSGNLATPDPPRFLDAVSRATCTVYPSVGAGQDLRFEGGGIVGAALDTNNGVGHVVAVPAADVIRSGGRRRFGVHIMATAGHAAASATIRVQLHLQPVALQSLPLLRPIGSDDIG
jgi:hypothetical protein